MSLVLYGAPLSPFVRKADIVLREKGLEFESDPVNIMPMPDWFKAISPARRIPVLRNKAISEEGTLGTIPDSSAICAYLERLEPEPSVYPSDPYLYGRAVWLEEYADTVLASPMGMGIFRPIFFNLMRKKEPDLDTARKTWNEDLPPIFDYLEGELAGDQGSNGFLVGDSLSVADAAVMSMLVQIELVAGVPDASRWPLLVGFFEQMAARPSVQPTYAICKKIATKQFDLSA